MEISGEIYVTPREGEPGFEARVAGVKNVMQRETLLTVTHDGGWQPFSALPDVKTPRFEGTMLTNTSGRFLDVMAVFMEPVPLLPGGVLTLGAAPPPPPPPAPTLPPSTIADGRRLRQEEEDLDAAPTPLGPSFEANIFLPKLRTTILKALCSGTTWCDDQVEPTFNFVARGDVCLQLSEEEVQQCIPMQLAPTDHAMVFEVRCQEA